jgi:hypothetical protein
MKTWTCSLVIALLALAGPASAAGVGSTVLAVVPGGGVAHGNFDDPLDVLGAPDYADPGGTGFGVGAYSLGTLGSITVSMSSFFRGDGTPAADLVIHEIGASSGGTAEATLVSVSLDGVAWTPVGSVPGGMSGIDLDAFGFGPVAMLRRVRLTDASNNPGQPAGSDIDAIVALNEVPTWTDVGSGLAGVNGIPQLAGAGTLAPGSSCSLTLSSARPSSPALLFVAFASVPVPFKGGVLVAWPATLTVPLATSGAGAIVLPFVWPSGVPSGTAIWFQDAVQDAAAIHGASLSNGLRGLTP